MNYWFDAFTGITWNEFRAAGAKTTGFRDHTWKRAEKTRPGDTLHYALRERIGVWYVDPKPANIDCGIEDPDWDTEPEIDYSQYEDERGEH